MKTLFQPRYILFTAIALMVLASCKVTQPYQQPALPTDSLYRDVAVSDTGSIATFSWEEFFKDENLKSLIKTGLDNNPDLLTAWLRVQQAESYLLQSRTAFFPTLNANAGATVAKLSEAQGFGIRDNVTQYELGLSSSWEIDVWGKLKSSRKAQAAALLQSQEGANAVKTALVANIANLYYTLLTLDEQLAITRQTVENWSITVETMRELKNAGRVTEAAVVQSEAQKYAAEVTIPDLLQSIRETENRLNVLLGRNPGPIQRTSLKAQQLPENLETGVPAQLLANRPDVKAAEYNYRYYFELTNVARTAFYPTLTITGSAGLSSLEISKLLDPASFAASVGAGILQPITGRRTNKTRYEVARYQEEEAYVNFRNRLLVAGEEVSNALSLYETAKSKIAVRTHQMAALEKSVDYSLELLQNGFANYTEVITARQSLLMAELGSVNDRFQQITATIGLYRALGGGWR